MNKGKNLNPHEPIRTPYTDYWDGNLDNILDSNMLNEVIRFHQSTSYIKRESWTNPYSVDTLKWLVNVENTDIVPNLYISEYIFEEYQLENKGSIRDFDFEEIPYYTLSNVIQKSFGRSAKSTSKRHPSAGGLYSVMPLICILKNYKDSQLTRGVYVYDSYRNSLKKIKEWNEEEYNDFIRVLTSWDNKIYSNYFIGYAIDLKRATAKYKKRGYRHALIELGTMTQSFKESLLDEKQNLYEFNSSAFDDNGLTYSMGLNPRLCPVTLVQWFGRSSKVL